MLKIISLPLGDFRFLLKQPVCSAGYSCTPHMIFSSSLKLPYVLHCAKFLLSVMQEEGEDTLVEHLLYQDYGGMLDYIPKLYPDVAFRLILLVEKTSEVFSKE